MAKGVLLFRAGSPYADKPDERYQFPKMYLNTAKTFVGDWVVYNELLDGKKGSGGYRRIAKVSDVIPDPSNEKMYLAIIDTETYMEFEQFVPYRNGSSFLESRLTTGTNRPSQLARVSVRQISDIDFYRICYRGNPLDTFELPRFDSEDAPQPKPREVAEAPNTFDFEDEPFVVERERFEKLVSKPVRKQLFRDRIIRAYEKTCAFTGMSLINGGGRAEVQAAHIMPVAAGGSDRTDNGLALSGTVHWMFDRGLISLSNEHDILVSRQVNNPADIWRIMRTEKKAHVPADERLRPNPKFLDWHRTNCYKN